MTKSRHINKPKAIWTADQIEIVRARYPHEKTAHIARDLGKGVDLVFRKAKGLGLSKTQAYLDSPDACRLRRDNPNSAGHRYPKGHVPANKGLRRLGWAPGRMAETQFKKGRKPEESRNYKLIGSLRITDSGYLERKVSDDQSIYPARRWVAVHRLVWIEANGPVPVGHLCVFKPGMKTIDPDQITLDKIDCVTFAENMLRNTCHNYPKEIAQLIQLRGAVQRKINRRTKDERNDQK